MYELKTNENIRIWITVKVTMWTYVNTLPLEVQMTGKLAHRPNVVDLKRHKLLKDLKKNKNIVILKPDKGNGVVVLDRTAYDSGILKIISDTSKFKVLTEDPT